MNKALERLLRALAITGAALVLATPASAGTITYSTNAAGTEFVSPITGLTLNSVSGGATLGFAPDVSISTGVPSNINFGIFTLSCSICLTNHADVETFNPFTFDLVIYDQTDNATGQFVGASSGGTVAFNSSTLTINWSPLQIGPGTSNALTNSFNTTYFAITTQSRIVAPNSGADIGQTTVQGGLNTNVVPEPGTLAAVGGALVALGLLRREHLLRR